MIKIENTNSIAIQLFGISKYLFVVFFVSPLLADSVHDVTDDFRTGDKGLLYNVDRNVNVEIFPEKVIAVGESQNLSDGIQNIDNKSVQDKDYVPHISSYLGKKRRKREENEDSFNSINDESTYVTDEHSDDEENETTNQDEQAEADQDEEETQKNEMIRRPEDISPSTSSDKESTEIIQIDTSNEDRKTPEDENEKPRGMDIFRIVPRMQARLGNITDFPSDWRDAPSTINVGATKVGGYRRKSRFRSTRRRLNRPIARWEHKEGLHKDDPRGCGFPICVDVDMKPKRFESMCRFVKWLKENGHERRIFVVQKGGCEDVIDEKEEIKKSTWVPISNYDDADPKSKPTGFSARNPCKDSHMHRWEHSIICKSPVCINALGIGDSAIANSFENIMTAMAWFNSIGRVKRKLLQSLLVIAVGLGECDTLYKGNLLTEYFDFDDPCVSPNDLGDAEDMISSFNFLKGLSYLTLRTNETTGEKYPYERHIGRHRCCSAANIAQHGMKFVTVRGMDKSSVPIERQRVSTTPYRIACRNSEMEHSTPDPPYWWDSSLKVRCIDWKFRYECKNMWGTVIPAKEMLSQYGGSALQGMIYNKTHDVIVDRVARTKGIFEGCDWKPFISTSYGKERDVELRTKILANSKRYAKQVCGNAKFSAMFIDARTNKEDKPWDETEDYKSGGITKITPFSGFYCESKNQNGKFCKDYKVRFCCAKPKEDQWEPWAKWSKCSKTCGGGKKVRTRRCLSANAHRKASQIHKCYGQDNPDYSKNEEDCSIEDCPVKFQWEEWKAWSDCSASCGEGTKQRSRICLFGKNGGENCPPDSHEKENEYRELSKCFLKKCSHYAWADWGGWSGCSSSTGFVRRSYGKKNEVKCGRRGIRDKSRYCHDVNYCFAKTTIPKGTCLHGNESTSESCAGDPCIVDGGWSEWRPWSNCNVDCGEGKQTRLRDCTKPFPSQTGKRCEGDYKEIQKCDKEPCPINCQWSAWGEWSKCSVKCGPDASAGTRERFRNIETEGKYGGRPCACCKPKEVEECIHCTVRPKRIEAEFRSENEKEFKEHCIPNCPVDCVWEPWTAWRGQCRACVKKETRRRHKRFEKKERYVRIFNDHGGKPCKTSEDKEIDLEVEEGYEEVKRKCQSPACPAVAAEPYWGTWEDWGSCEESPGCPCNKEYYSGRRTRRRECRVGRDGSPNLRVLPEKECRKKHHHDGRSYEENKCPPPCTSFPPWSTWTAWSACNVHCGAGKQSGTRRCNEIPGKDLKHQICEIGKTENRHQVCDMGPCGHKNQHHAPTDRPLQGPQYQSKGPSKKADDQSKEHTPNVKPRVSGEKYLPWKESKEEDGWDFFKSGKIEVGTKYKNKEADNSALKNEVISSDPKQKDSTNEQKIEHTKPKEQKEGRDDKVALDNKSGVEENSKTSTETKTSKWMTPKRRQDVMSIEQNDSVPKIHGENVKSDAVKSPNPGSQETYDGLSNPSTMEIMDFLEDSSEDNSGMWDLDPDDESKPHEPNAKPRVPGDKSLPLKESKEEEGWNFKGGKIEVGTKDKKEEEENFALNNDQISSYLKESSVSKHEKEVEDRKELRGYRSKTIAQPHEANIKSFQNKKDLEQDSTTEGDESEEIILTRRILKDHGA